MTFPFKRNEHFSSIHSHLYIQLQYFFIIHLEKIILYKFSELHIITHVQHDASITNVFFRSVADRFGMSQSTA